jgi:hypothetical protein
MRRNGFWRECANEQDWDYIGLTRGIVVYPTMPPNPCGLSSTTIFTFENIGKPSSRDRQCMSL